MGLNKVKKNGLMYEFISHTWNPLAGECPHKCVYCSTNKFFYPVLKKKYSGQTRLEANEFKTNLGKGNFIFVVAQNDLFADNIPDEWILQVLRKCYDYNTNRYLFQTKNPERVLEFNHFVFRQSVVCTTLESNRFYPEVMGNSPHPIRRSFAMEKISQVVDTYVTIEPILDFNLSRFVTMIQRCNPKQVNIGYDSGNNNLPEPSKEKVEELIKLLKEFTNVHLKKNYGRKTN